MFVGPASTLIVSTVLAASLAACSVGGGQPSSLPAVSSTVLSQATPPGSGLPEATGVAGIDDPDPFCASWAVYSGTLQTIGIAHAFGGLAGGDLARLELFAAASLIDAVNGIGSRWPAALVAERSVVLSDLVGPFSRRAEKAMSALRAAGLTDDEVAELRIAWRATLRTRDPRAPAAAVPSAPPTLAAKVNSAAAAFDAAVTPFAEDPSLVVDSVSTPLTDSYLGAHCPDLASSGVGDAV